MAKRLPPKMPNGKRMTPNKPVKSWRKGKKKAVYACSGDKCRLLHFGDSTMSDYTLHKNKKRRANYKARHGGIKLKNGKPAYKDKLQAAYWSWRVLW